jgi:hypothetical protein
MPPIPRPLIPDDRFVLTLDGVVCGDVIAAEGGDISAPVIREPNGSGFVRKHLGSATPKPIELALGLSLRPVVYEWINAFWQGQISRKDGALISVDASLRAKGHLVFERAVIDATLFPTVDAAVGDLGRFAVTIQPARTTFAPGSGQPVHGLLPKEASHSWRESNFRLQIEGLDCTRVSKVEAAEITSSAEVIDFPDVRITLAEAGSERWSAWRDEFVEKEENDAEHEKTGTLTFLGPDMKTELGSVKLSGLGIYRLAPETTSEESRRTIKRLVAELYCQRMELSVPAKSFTPP